MKTVLKRILLMVLSVHFFLGAALLPKGDFALIADLPAMYHQYQRIDDPADISPVDFVVDYLLNGEAISGGDVYRGRTVPYNSVQFQHQANALNFILHAFTLPVLHPHEVTKIYFLKNDTHRYNCYLDNIFRPPVTCS